MDLSAQFPKEPAMTIFAAAGASIAQFAKNLQATMQEDMKQGMEHHDFIRGQFQQTSFDVKPSYSTADIIESYYCAAYSSERIVQAVANGSDIRDGLFVMNRSFVDGLASGAIPADHAKNLAKDLGTLNTAHARGELGAKHAKTIAKVWARINAPEVFFGKDNKPGLAVGFQP